MRVYRLLTGEFKRMAVRAKNLTKAIKELGNWYSEAEIVAGTLEIVPDDEVITLGPDKYDMESRTSREWCELSHAPFLCSNDRERVNRVLDEAQLRRQDKLEKNKTSSKEKEQIEQH